MTDTNKQKGTFDSYINFLLCDDYTNACDLIRYKKIKQLHNKSLLEHAQKNTYIFTEEITKLTLQLREKDNKIKELQAEKLKIKKIQNKFEHIFEVIK